MKYSAALVAATAVAVRAQPGCNDEGGNWFCKKVNMLQYTGLNIPGSYQAVSSMPASGKCTFETVTYHSPIAPFDEGLSIHVRGPSQIAQVAVYYPKTSKKPEEHKSHSKRHGHNHLHKKFHEHKEEERAVGDIVTATIDGKLVQWTNAWDGKGAAAPAPSAASAPAVDVNLNFAKAGKPSGTSSSSASKSKGSASSSNVKFGDYERVAYYDAVAGTATGLTFMANLGGQGSGVWDSVYGNSLSYVDEKGTGGAAGPTVLGNVLIPSNAEIAIYSDVECKDAGTCGFYRPGIPAYEGFVGADKVFAFRIKMPMDPGASGMNADMPALWFLNAKIAHTAQYSACSCWGTDKKNSGGCGEFDVLEVLAAGDTKCKSTFHYTNSIGNSDWMQRPVDDYINVAAVFQESSATATIALLDDDFDFAAGLSADAVEDMINDKKVAPGLIGLMAIPSISK